jgi:hypothetical protein
MIVQRVVFNLILAWGLLFTPPTAPVRAEPPRAGSEMRVTTATVTSAPFPLMAMAADGRFIIVWDATVWGSERRMMMRRFAADGTPLTGEVRVNSDPEGQSTGVNGSFAVAMAPDGRFVVTWDKLGSGGIAARRFDSAGAPQGDDIDVNVPAPGTPGGPAVGMAADGSFVVAWTQDLTIFGRRFDADGAPLGDNILLSAHGVWLISQFQNAALAMAADGRFVARWREMYMNAVKNWTCCHEYIQRFNRDATPAGPALQVGTPTSAFEFQTIAMAPDASFVVAWAAGQTVYGQRFAADGTPQSDKFIANDPTGHTDAGNVVAAITPDGRFVIAWDDLTNFHVYARRYARGGIPVGEPFRVDTASQNTGQMSTVGGADSHYAIAWVRWYPGSPAAGDIIAQRFEWDSAPVAQDDVYSLTGSTLAVPVPGVLWNDQYSSPSSLTAELVSGPSAGTLQLAPNGAFTYVPGPSFSGSDQFTYRATAGNVSNPATVTITSAAVACPAHARITSQALGDRLDVQVEAASTPGYSPTTLRALRFGTFQNARVAFNGQPVTSGQTVSLSPNSTVTGFSVTRAVPGQPTTVPFTVVDGCGEWPTFVGGGTSAGF